MKVYVKILQQLLGGGAVLSYFLDGSMLKSYTQRSCAKCLSPFN